MSSRRRRPPRILIAKPGLDGHDRGARVVALALRNAGFEVIYTGLHRRVEEIVEAALQEDPDVVGVSILSGAHLTIAARLMEQLRQAGLRPVVVVGGNIPRGDAPRLLAFGISAVYPTGSRFDDIAAGIVRLLDADGAEAAAGRNT